MPKMDLKIPFQCDDKENMKMSFGEKKTCVGLPLIREIPDHATLREKVQRLGWLDKLWVFFLWTCVIMQTLTTCSFQGILLSKNVNINKKYIEYSLSHDVTQLGT